MKNVAIDEEGFANVSVIHSTCGAGSSYAFAPLGTEGEQFECDHCGEVLLKLTVEQGEAVPDACEL